MKLHAPFVWVLILKGLCFVVSSDQLNIHKLATKERIREGKAEVSKFSHILFSGASLTVIFMRYELEKRLRSVLFYIDSYS